MTSKADESMSNGRNIFIYKFIVSMYMSSVLKTMLFMNERALLEAMRGRIIVVVKAMNTLQK